MESLFSLEVIVNYIKLKHPFPSATPNTTHDDTPVITCLLPTLAFRLLDYPTIAIHLLDQYNATQIKKQFNRHSPNQIQRIAHLPCFKDLLDNHGRYIFAKGKSCLFRCEISALKTHLSHTPMYLIVLQQDFLLQLGNSRFDLSKLISPEKLA